MCRAISDRTDGYLEFSSAHKFTCRGYSRYSNCRMNCWKSCWFRTSNQQLNQRYGFFQSELTLWYRSFIFQRAWYLQASLSTYNALKFSKNLQLCFSTATCNSSQTLKLTPSWTPKTANPYYSNVHTSWSCKQDLKRPKTRTVVFCMCWGFGSYAQKSLAGVVCNCKDKKSFSISESGFDCRRLFRFFRMI